MTDPGGPEDREGAAPAVVGGPAPWSEVLSVGYDDGPVIGAARCRDSGRTFRFEALALDHAGEYDRAAWDRGEEVRIFGLADLPGERYEWLRSALAPAPGEAMSPDDQELLAAARRALAAAGPTRYALAAHGIAGTVVALRAVPGAGRVDDWFAFLGLVRRRP